MEREIVVLKYRAQHWKLFAIELNLKNKQFTCINFLTFPVFFFAVERNYANGISNGFGFLVFIASFLIAKV